MNLLAGRARHLGAAIGFFALAAYIVVPEGINEGWPLPPGYYLGTGVGVGVVGAVIGWLIGAFMDRRD